VAVLSKVVQSGHQIDGSVGCRSKRQSGRRRLANGECEGPAKCRPDTCMVGIAILNANAGDVLEFAPRRCVARPREARRQTWCPQNRRS